MATFPTQPPKPPKAFEHGSGFGSTAPAKVPSGETAKTKPKSLATSTHGKRDPDSGGMVYKAGGMILGSGLLRAWMGRGVNPNTVPPQDPEETAAPRQV